MNALLLSLGLLLPATGFAAESAVTGADVDEIRTVIHLVPPARTISA